MSIRGFAFCALLTALAACEPDKPVEHPTAEKPPAEKAEKKRQPVVVAIVVDQFGAWVADERLPKLPPGGLFTRFREKGTWVHAMRYPYATTDTAPGHTSLHTGRFPAESGIVMNEVIEETHGHKVSVLRDLDTKMVTPTGIKDVPVSSVVRLRVPTVGDRLRDARPNAKVISVSLKDRSTLLPAGHHPSHAIFFETAETSFVTTTAIENTFPAWAKAAGDVAAIEKSYETKWEATDPAWLAKVAGKDDAPGEGDLVGLGTVFPHTVKNAPSFRASPKSDAAILDIALAGALAEHDPNEPLLLLVSMSAFDVIGHTFGVDSWESWDQFAKLDIALAKFVDALEAKLGPVSVVLSADHGTVSMPESRHLPCEQPRNDLYDRPLCVGGARIMPIPVREELEKAAVAKLGKGPWITGIADGYVYITTQAKALPPEKRAELMASMESVFKGPKWGPLVKEVWDVQALTKKCATVTKRPAPERAKRDEPWDALLCRSWNETVGYTGDVYVVPAYGSFWDAEIVSGKGTSHGTPYLHDRTAPFFALGPSIKHREVNDPVDFSVYSAVYAAFVGLDSRDPNAIVDSLTAH